VWLEQRFVALHIDHDGVVAEAQHARGLGQSIGAGCVIGAREDGFDAVSCDDVDDALVVGRDHDPCRTPLARARSATRNHHRLAADIGQGLAGEPRRRVARVE